MLEVLGIDKIYKILKAISEKPCTKSELLALWPSGSMHQKVEKLKEKGVINEQEVREGKTRYKLYTLTPKGRKLLELLEEIKSLDQNA